MTDQRPGGLPHPVGPHFVEYPLGVGVQTARTLADALITAAVTSAAGFFLGILPLVGVVDEHALGYEAHEAVDHWSRVWVGVTIGIGVFVLGLLAVVCTTAADVATRARLRREAEAPGAAERIPVFQQRRLLSADVWGPARTASGGVAVFAGSLVALFVIAMLYLVSKHSNDLGAAGIATGALAVLTAVSIAIYRWTKHRTNWKSKATAQWSEQAAKVARDAAKDERRRQGQAVPTGGDRLRTLMTGPVNRTLVWVAVAWALAGVVMVFIRKPGRNAAPNHFSDPVEGGIEAIWRVLVVSGLALLVLGVAAWLFVLALDIGRLAGLGRRARTAQELPRPDTPALQRAVDVPGVYGLLGRSLIAFATLLGTAAFAMVLSDEGPAGLRSGSLTVAGVAAVLGLLSTAAGYSVARGGRARIRALWPVSDAPVVAEGKRAQRRAARAGSSSSSDLL